VPDAVLDLGCGFAEAGTLTPKPQSGNPAPRVFRLVEDEALINRLGFNNGGHAGALERLKKRSERGGVVGVNIGANKDSQDRTADYVDGLETFWDVASYFTVNISSPNTPGLRDLQAPEALDELLGRVMACRRRKSDETGFERPVIVKIAPDVAEDDLPAICERFVHHGVEGIAVSNTTLARGGLRSGWRAEAGGLSGAPLFDRSTAMLAKVYRQTGGAVPLIGIGGINSGERAVEKIRAGASLIQLYTALVYRGPGLIGEILSCLGAALDREGATSLTAIKGSKADDWAAKPLVDNS